MTFWLQPCLAQPSSEAFLMGTHTETHNWIMGREGKLEHSVLKYNNIIRSVPSTLGEQCGRKGRNIIKARVGR